VFNDEGKRRKTETIFVTLGVSGSRSGCGLDEARGEMELGDKNRGVDFLSDRVERTYISSTLTTTYDRPAWILPSTSTLSQARSRTRVSQTPKRISSTTSKVSISWVEFTLNPGLTNKLSLRLSQRPLSVSPPSTALLDKHQNGPTMVDTSPLARIFFP
jgi:hypothetical protein